VSLRRFAETISIPSATWLIRSRYGFGRSLKRLLIFLVVATPVGRLKLVTVSVVSGSSSQAATAAGDFALKDGFPPNRP